MITASWTGVPVRDDLVAEVRGLVARPERLDALCLAGLVATQRVLAAAALSPASIGERSHALVGGTALGCLETDLLYYGQIIDVGLERANPRLFAYTLANMVLGEVAIAHGWMGDQLAIAAGRASGLTALSEAASLVASGEVDVAVALVLDVVGPTAKRVFDAVGTTPLPSMSAFVVESPASAAARTGTILATVAGGCGFDPEATMAWPDPDPLAAEGLPAVFDALSRTLKEPVRVEVACASGHTAWLVLTPTSWDRSPKPSALAQPAGTRG